MQAKPGLVGKHHTRPLLWCPKCMLCTPGLSQAAASCVTAKYRSSFGVVTRGATCAVTSTHITIILESLPKPGDDTLGDSKFLGYFQLGTSTF
ncbi:hypothetical protein TNCV_2179881 [Trichonephila clavipes]|uniref:Uncharacterized protein n=1 Tax=Trichonephila clavipes TaxID=2585209 RepID=A0A8X7B9D1_TRICX|nr:hypothetical protein TNCV_2179881 [Trichonephila clavipes]